MVYIARRPISAEFRRQLFTPHRDKIIRPLVTIDHESFATPLRFVSGDPREFSSLVSNGNTFITFPFEVSIPTDDDNEPEARLTIQNVDDRIGTTILNLPNDALLITLQVVLHDAPDVIELEVVNMEMVDVEINALTVSGRLILRGSVGEPCPGRTLTNRISPVFFR